MMNKKLGRTLSRSELRGVKGGESCSAWCADEDNCSCAACKDECRDACDYEEGPDTCAGIDCCVPTTSTCCI